MNLDYAHIFCFPSSHTNHHMLSEIYGKVVVASKVPLPNYRPDLDDKRPQREVRLFPVSFRKFSYMKPVMGILVFMVH